MKSPALLPTIGCVLLGAALVLKFRTTSTESTQARESYHKLSNDWHHAVLKLDEQSRLSFTLQTGLKLLNQEHLAATNELSTLRSGVHLLQSNQVALLESCKTGSNQLRLKVLEFEDEQMDFRQRLAQADFAMRQATQSLATAKQSLEIVARGSTEQSNRIKQLEMANRSLEARWADPALLHAQWQIQEKAAKTETNSSTKSGRLALQPDGSVRIVP